MKLAEPLVRLCDYPAEAIARVLPGVDAPIWDADRSRQTTYAVHRLTRSILFEWLDNDWQIGGPVVVHRYDYAPADLRAAVYSCVDRLASFYPGGRLVRMTLAEVPARARIPAHVDNGIGVTAVHRCHVPVISSKDVQFLIDHVPYYLEPGYTYEFDNTRAHAVNNLSDERRVHLMCDFMPASLIA